MNVRSVPTPSGEVVPAFVFVGNGTCWLVVGGSFYVSGTLVIAGTACVVESDAQAVSQAEPANGPAVFDSRLEGLDGASLLVGDGLVAGGVAGDRGGGSKFEVSKQSCYVVVLLGGGGCKARVGVGELMEGEAAVHRGVGHPVEVAVKRL